MKIGIMQPYFFPYFPYFQLIKSVDVYVNLDHVNFMVRSFMTRNTISTGERINVPVYKASQNKKCTEIYAALEKQYVTKFLSLIYTKYSKTPNYNSILALFESEFQDLTPITISEFNFKLIVNICKYLNIKTEMIYSSQFLTDLKGEEAIIDIVKNLNGKTYINAIGGADYYSKVSFNKNDIELKFIKTENEFNEYKNNSILDILFNYPLEEILIELDKYTFV